MNLSPSRIAVPLAALVVGLVACNRTPDQQTPDAAPAPKVSSEVKPPMKLALKVDGESLQPGDERAVASLQQHYSRCEAVALERGASLPATVTLVVTVGTNGNVTEAVGQGTTEPSSGMDCLIDATKPEAFPAGPKRTFKITIQRD